MLAEDPDDAFCRYALALKYASDMDCTEEALHLLQELISSNPAYLPAYYQLAVLLLRMGKIPEGAETIHQGIKVAQDQNNKHAVSELFQLLEALDET